MNIQINDKIVKKLKRSGNAFYIPKNIYRKNIYLDDYFCYEYIVTTNYNESFILKHIHVLKQKHYGIFVSNDKNKQNIYIIYSLNYINKIIFTQHFEDNYNLGFYLDLKHRRNYNINKLLDI